MDDRRNFLTKLIGSGALGAISLPEVKTPVQDRMKYKGYSLFWSGWKDIPNMDVLCAQWTAIKLDSENKIYTWGYYASYPGGQDRYYPGQIFNTLVYANQVPVMRALHTPEQMEEFRLEALQRVMELIDDNA